MSNVEIGYLVGFAHYAMAALSLVADPACWEEDGRGQPFTATPALVVGVALFVGASIEQVREIGRVWDRDPSTNPTPADSCAHHCSIGATRPWRRCASPATAVTAAADGEAAGSRREEAHSRPRHRPPTRSHAATGALG